MTRKQPIRRVAVRKTPLSMENLAKQGRDTRTLNQQRGELWRIMPGLGTATQDALGLRVISATLESIAAQPATSPRAIGAFAAEIATTLGVTGRILLEQTRWRNQAPGSKTRDTYHQTGSVASLAPGTELVGIVRETSELLDVAQQHADTVVASFTKPGYRALRHNSRQALGENLLAGAISLAPLADLETLQFEGDPVVRSEIGVACFDEIDTLAVSAARQGDILPSLIQFGREEGHTIVEQHLYSIPDAHDLVAGFVAAQASVSFDMFDRQRMADA